MDNLIFWDGQGTCPEEHWDGKCFISYESFCGYISRYTDKTEMSENLPDLVDYTGEVSGKAWKTPYEEGDIFSIFTDSYSMIIEDKVQVLNGKLLVLESTQLL